MDVRNDKPALVIALGASAGGVSALREFFKSLVHPLDAAILVIQQARGQHYDVVLMDLQMPKMDGYTALKELRGQRYDQPIVALTAHALKSERDRCFGSGFDGYVTKPIDGRTLLRTIQDLLI